MSSLLHWEYRRAVKHEIVFLNVMMSNSFEMNTVYSYYMIIMSFYTVSVT